MILAELIQFGIEEWGETVQRQSFWRCLKLCGVCAAIGLSSLDTTFAQQARNQFGANSRNRPTVSPYLSLIDNGSGNDTSQNFYNIVKPQQRAQRAARNFQNELQTVESSLQNPSNQNSLPVDSIPITTGKLPATGHSTAFGDVGGRFGGGAGGAGGNNFGRNGKRR